MTRRPRYRRLNQGLQVEYLLRHLLVRRGLTVAALSQHDFSDDPRPIGDGCPGLTFDCNGRFHATVDLVVGGRGMRPLSCEVRAKSSPFHHQGEDCYGFDDGKIRDTRVHECFGRPLLVVRDASRVRLAPGLRAAIRLDEQTDLRAWLAIDAEEAEDLARRYTTRTGDVVDLVPVQAFRPLTNFLPAADSDPFDLR